MRIDRVLVTGATGKIGRSLVPALLDAGYRVRATQFVTPVQAPRVETVVGSVSDEMFVHRALEGVDAVCHLASSKEDREGFLDVSVRGTFHLLDQARQRGILKQFLLASGDATMGIFFYPHDRPLDENAPLAAYPGYYPFSKVLEETMVGQYRIQHALPVTVLRCSWVHAEDDILAHMTLRPPDFGAPSWRDLAGPSVKEQYLDAGRDAAVALAHPDGRPFIRHIVGVRDVVQAFMRALGNPAAAGQTFNIAGPAAFSYATLAGDIGNKLGMPVVSLQSEMGHDFSIDINKARSILGYEPEMDVFRMVDEARAFRQHGGRRSPVRYPG